MFVSLSTNHHTLKNVPLSKSVVLNRLKSVPCVQPIEEGQSVCVLQKLP